jgi:large subunit ribosomal protein L2
MKLLKLNPITNSQRHQLILQKNILSKNNRLSKKNLINNHSFCGRSSNNGRITVRHKGGGIKHLFRIIRFSNENSKGIVLANMYDPNRNAFISLIFDLEKKNFFQILSTNLVLSGALFSTSLKNAELRLGFRSTMKNIPTGSVFHSLSLNKKEDTKYARAAGNFCQILQKKKEYSNIKLPSGKIIKVSINSMGTIGILSNVRSQAVVIGNAGKNRRRGIRPTVRGIAMNPVDHPHGGRTNGGIHWVTPWGKPTKK